MCLLKVLTARDAQNPLKTGSKPLTLHCVSPSECLSPPSPMSSLCLVPWPLAWHHARLTRCWKPQSIDGYVATQDASFEACPCLALSLSSSRLASCLPSPHTFPLARLLLATPMLFMFNSPPAFSSSCLVSLLLVFALFAWLLVCFLSSTVWL